MDESVTENQEEGKGKEGEEKVETIKPKSLKKAKVGDLTMDDLNKQMEEA